MLRKQLTFVHPTVLDDPYELHFLHEAIKNKIRNSDGKLEAEVIGAIMEQLISNKLYIQSWTTVNESDALWNIYSHGGTSVRIEIDRDTVRLLDDVKIIEVKYDNNIDQTEHSFYDLIGLKRKAFSHEKEVRLVKHYRFHDTDDAKEHLIAFLAINRVLDKYFHNIGIENIDKEIKKLVTLTNQNIQKKTMTIGFEQIDNFIESVMLNPLAPDWVNDTLHIFCAQQKLNYLEKSQLYKK